MTLMQGGSHGPHTPKTNEPMRDCPASPLPTILCTSDAMGDSTTNDLAGESAASAVNLSPGAHPGLQRPVQLRQHQRIASSASSVSSGFQQHCSVQSATAYNSVASSQSILTTGSKSTPVPPTFASSEERSRLQQNGPSRTTGRFADLSPQVSIGTRPSGIQQGIVAKDTNRSAPVQVLG